nr:uncharacterized protein LOC117691343 isoform X2 [Crassostrea gigas]
MSKDVFGRLKIQLYHLHQHVLQDILAKSARLVPQEGTVTSVKAGVIQSVLLSIATMSKDVFGRLKIQLYHLHQYVETAVFHIALIGNRNYVEGGLLKIENRIQNTVSILVMVSFRCGKHSC